MLNAHFCLLSTCNQGKCLYWLQLLHVVLCVEFLELSTAKIWANNVPCGLSCLLIT